MDGYRDRDQGRRPGRGKRKKDKWEIARDKDTKVTGEDLKVGSKVTVYYTMKASSIEVKAGGEESRTGQGRTAKSGTQETIADHRLKDLILNEDKPGVTVKRMFLQGRATASQPSERLTVPPRTHVESFAAMEATCFLLETWRRQARSCRYPFSPGAGGLLRRRKGNHP